MEREGIATVPSVTGDAVDTAAASAPRRLVRRTLKDSAIYMPATIVQGLGGIVVTMVVSKLSTPDSFGNYTMGVNLSMALSMLAGQWMNESLIRLTPEYARQQRKQDMYGTLIYSAVAATIVVGILFGVVLLSLQSLIDSDLYKYLAVAVATFPLMVAFSAVRSWCRSTGRSVAFSALIIWRIVGGILLGLGLFLLFQTGTIGFLWGMVLAWSVVAIGFPILRRSTLWSIMSPRRFSREIVVDALRYSLPMSGIAVSGLALSISDRYLIGGFLSSYQVGIYALGYSIAQRGMELVTQSFFRAMQPIVFRAWSEDGQAATRRLVEQLSRYYALAAIPLATGITVLSREVVVLFSTMEYADGAQVVGVVSAAMICYGYARLYEVSFALSKRTMPLLVVYLVSTALNLVVNIIWIPRYGYIVAAWSTLASYALMAIMLGLWSLRGVRICVFGTWIWKPLAGSAIMALAVVELKRLLGPGIPSLMLEVIVGVVVYAVVVVVVRGVSVGELRAMIRLVNRRLSRIR